MILKNYLKRVMPSLSSGVFVLVWFAIAPLVRAVVPPPDGGYPGFNTAEGQNALFNLTTGVGNTALRWFSLWSDTDGSYDTLWVRERSFSTSEIKARVREPKTPPLARQPF
jgi:hypothetical protein